MTSYPTLRTVPCRLSLASTAEREAAAAAGIRAATLYVVVFAAGALVEATHRLVVTGTTDTGDGAVGFSHTLDVVTPPATDRAGEFLRKVYATEAP